MHGKSPQHAEYACQTLRLHRLSGFVGFQALKMEIFPAFSEKGNILVLLGVCRLHIDLSTCIGHGPESLRHHCGWLPAVRVIAPLCARANHVFPAFSEKGNIPLPSLPQFLEKAGKTRFADTRQQQHTAASQANSAEAQSRR